MLFLRVCIARNSYILLDASLTIAIYRLYRLVAGPLAGRPGMRAVQAQLRRLSRPMPGGVPLRVRYPGRFCDVEAVYLPVFEKKPLCGARGGLGDREKRLSRQATSKQNLVGIARSPD
jgi:hypothetical protein